MPELPVLHEGLPPHRRLLGRGAILLITSVVLLVAAAITLSHIDRHVDTSDEDGGRELVMGGTDPLVPVTPPGVWQPKELGYDDLVIDETGAVVAVPDPGITTLADLARAVAEPPPSSIAPVPGQPATATGTLATMVGFVPPDAFTVVGVDLDRLRSSPAVRGALTHLLQSTGAAGGIDAAIRAGSVDPLAASAMVIAGVEGSPGEEPRSLLVLAGAFDHGRIANDLVAGGGRLDARSPDATNVIVDGYGVSLRDPGLIVVAAEPIFEEVLATVAGPTVAYVGDLREPVNEGLGSAGFVALRIPTAQRTTLATTIPDLATAEWIAARVDPGAGLAIRATMRMPDEVAATRTAGALDMLRQLGRTQLGASSPDAAGALDAVAVAWVGPTVQLTATLDDAKAAALLVELTR